MEPADEHLTDPAGCQVVGQLADDQLAELVAAETAVAVDDLVLGRDHIRRVADDQVELLARDRLEEVPLAELDPVGAVQLGVEGSEPQSARIDVDRRDLLDVMRGEQRLVAVAGPEVERPRDRPPYRQPRENASGRRDTEHVIRAGELLLECIAGDEHVLRRDELDVGLGLAAGDGQDAHRLEPVERERRERLVGLGLGHLEVEQEELDQRRELPAPAEHVEIKRHLGRVAAARHLGRERVAHRRGSEPGLDQNIAE